MGDSLCGLWGPGSMVGSGRLMDYSQYGRGGDGADVTYPIRMCAMSMLMCHLSHGAPHMRVCGITGIQRDQSRPGTLAFSFRYV